MAVCSAIDGPACKGDQMWQYIYSTTDYPGITGSKGDQMWQHLMQWMVQIL